jgi:hypothetical protein
MLNIEHIHCDHQLFHVINIHQILSASQSNRTNQNIHNKIFSRFRLVLLYGYDSISALYTSVAKICTSDADNDQHTVMNHNLYNTIHIAARMIEERKEVVNEVASTVREYIKHSLMIPSIGTGIQLELAR